MAVAVTERDLAEALAEAPFARIYDFRIEAFGDGECTIAVPFQPSYLRPDGVLSGPLMMAAADVAMWLAIITRLGRSAHRAVTTELTTAFLSAARREDLRCTARVLKLGRRLVYGVAECVGASGRLLTHHTVTYILPGDLQAAEAPAP